MIVDSIIVPGGISSADGYVCAGGKISEESGLTDFLFKTWYNRNVKLGLMYKITQLWSLKVQSCKLYNNKCMIASTHITNTEIFTFIGVLVFKLLSRKVLLISRKDN